MSRQIPLYTMSCTYAITEKKLSWVGHYDYTDKADTIMMLYTHSLQSVEKPQPDPSSIGILENVWLVAHGVIYTYMYNI